MKRSKIFLGVASCFLAIAGIAATKAHHTTSTPGYYFTALTPSTCRFDANVQCTVTNNNAALCKQTIGHGSYTLFYTVGATTQICDHKLFVTITQ